MTDMAFFGKKFSTLFAIYVALCIATADGLKTQKWTHHFGNSVFEQDKSSLTSPGQVYGNCETSLVQKKFEGPCKFAIENTDVAVDLLDHVRMCNFTLSKDIPQSDEMYLLDEVVAITKDRAVLQFKGLSSNILFVLNFADCTVANSHMSEHPMSVHAPTKDKFDVITTKNHHTEDKYRTILDNNGNVKSEEKLWLKSDSNIIAAADSPAKGRLVIDVINTSTKDKSKSAVRLNAVSDSGSIDTVKEYPIDKEGYGNRWIRFVESTMFNLVSLCARLDTTMKCSQYDLNGNVKFETEISLAEHSPIHSLRLYNLPKGGFLLFISKCQSGEKPVCVLKKQSFGVKKIDAAGKSVATLKVDDNNDRKLVHSGVIHVFENDKNEVCLSNVRSKPNNWYLMLDVFCLREEEFSGKVTWPTD